MKRTNGRITLSTVVPVHKYFGPNILAGLERCAVRSVGDVRLDIKAVEMR
jgi:hypothetical protein